MASLRSFVFEDLPRELRDGIYEELLVAKGYCVEDILCMPPDEDPPGELYPCILATNKKIHDEAAPFLYGKNRFSYEVYGFCLQRFLTSEGPERGIPKRYANLMTRLSIAINFQGSDSDMNGDGPAFEIVRSNVKQLADSFVDNHHIDLLRLSFINSYFNPGLSGLLPNSFRGNWAMGEKVLAPLATLRGVRKVVLKDHARESNYAHVLKGVMESPHSGR
ncbi:hypothetical protein MMC13_001747 [Lambiella insularis]|nr:hypothetical protein [Lambiella insularis]